MQFSPWWWCAAPPSSPPAGSSAEPAALPAQIDVAVIGGGFTGLAAALTLAGAGRGVLLLEAAALGCGASTRNGGQVGSGNQKFAAHTLIARYGRERAVALLREGTQMLEHIAALVAEQGIDCHFARVGRFRGALRPAHYQRMAREMEDLQRLAGVEFEMLPRAAQHREIASDAYHGGALLPNDAAVHPALLHRGLAERATAAGALLIEHTPLRAIRRDGAGFRLQTDRGSLRAGAVVATTNGYSGAALPALRRRTVAVGSSIIATEELPAGRIAELLPGGRVYGDSARVFNYYRASPDGRRILFGGRSAWPLSSVGEAVPGVEPDGGWRQFRHLYHDLLAVFPQLDGVRISHAWHGWLGFTRDGLPGAAQLQFGEHAGIWYALGYCGTGVSRSLWFGRKVALKLLGDAEGASAFDGLDLRPFAMRRAAPLGVAASTAWYRLRDALER